ncbi:N-acetyltransferase [Streptomyces sp. TS71-3]|uniref:GNAT family N-acetyltransferase n=1 Tax=Streptomyces sp. TS71-3 TaxID=2733862 RepID=UPI001BB36B89|nr:GNAT family N-acetyltransferase [Streptomyces sp. TS71-3]
MVSHMFRVETETAKVDRPRRDLLRARLREANTAASPIIGALRGTADERELPLQIWVFSDEGGGEELVAGLDAHTWAHWLHVNLLWVDARHRATGLGSRLLLDAERTAREDRGCLHSRVWTWDFQAPDFYRKYGYDVVCEIPDYPPGITEYTLTKRLA